MSIEEIATVRSIAKFLGAEMYEAVPSGPKRKLNIRGQTADNARWVSGGVTLRLHDEGRRLSNTLRDIENIRSVHRNQYVRDLVPFYIYITFDTRRISEGRPKGNNTTS